MINSKYIDKLKITFYGLFVCLIIVSCHSTKDVYILKGEGLKLRSVASIENTFLNNWDKELNIALPKSLSGDSWDLYNLAYYIDANTSMFQATSDVKYLDRSILYITNVISKATYSYNLKGSQFKDSYLGWGNHSSPSQGNDGKEYPLFESFLWRYVSNMLFVMNDHSSLLENPKYLGEYERILDFTKKHIFDKWLERGRNHLYRSNTHMASHWAFIALNLNSISPQEKYYSIARDYADSLKNRRVSLGKISGVNIYHWDPVWKRKYTRSQDVGHGNAVIGLMVEMYERKLFFDEDDINGLVLLFNNVIWKSKDSYSYYFDGSGKGSGWFSDGLIKLGRYSGQLQKRLESHNKGRSTQFFGNLALNRKLLQDY